METTTSRPAARRPSPGALPIVAIGGRWGKTTVARLLEAMLRDTFPRLALWLDQGVLVNRRKLSGELIPWGDALRSLAAGDLDLAIQELDAHDGFRVPSDIAVIGYDNNHFASENTTPISTVVQPGEGMGEIAADLLLEKITIPDAAARTVVVQPHLIPRRSTLGELWRRD